MSPKLRKHAVSGPPCMKDTTSILAKSGIPQNNPKQEGEEGRYSFEKKVGTGGCKIIQSQKLKINDRVSDLRKHNIFSWRTEIQDSKGNSLPYCPTFIPEI